MTCLIATLAGIWADRKIHSDTGERCDQLSKVTCNSFLVAAFAGDFNGILKGWDAVRDGAATPQELARTLSAGVEGLVVFQGRIYCLDARRAWKRRPGCKWYCAGTGGAQAAAFLAGRGKCRAQDVKAAQAYVARVRDDCGGGVDFLPAV